MFSQVSQYYRQYFKRGAYSTAEKVLNKVMNAIVTYPVIEEMSFEEDAEDKVSSTYTLTNSDDAVIALGRVLEKALSNYARFQASSDESQKKEIREKIAKSYFKFLLKSQYTVIDAKITLSAELLNETTLLTALQPALTEINDQLKPAESKQQASTCFKNPGV